MQPISDPNANKMERNATCDGLEPPLHDGMVLYPPVGVNFWLPLDIPNSTENRQLVSEILSKRKSLVIDGCFAYRTSEERHTSSFRFFLRDIPNMPSYAPDKDGKLTPAWNFNVTLSGNEAN